MAEVRCGSCGHKIEARPDAGASGNPAYDALMVKLDRVIGDYHKRFEESFIEMLRESCDPGGDVPGRSSSIKTA